MIEELLTNHAEEMGNFSKRKNAFPLKESLDYERAHLVLEAMKQNTKNFNGTIVKVSISLSTTLGLADNHIASLEYPTAQSIQLLVGLQIIQA